MPLFSWADVLRHGGQVVVLLLAGSLHSIVKDEVKEVLRRFLGLAKEQAEPLLRRARSLREERNGWTVVREVLKVLIGICVVVAATNAALGVRWVRLVVACPKPENTSTLAPSPTALSMYRAQLRPPPTVAPERRRRPAIASRWSRATRGRTRGRWRRCGTK